MRDGDTTIGGRIPVNASGGLACFGEAVPAQAIAQVCEVAWHLRGEAGARQVEGARVGLTINQGLFGHGSCVIVEEVGRWTGTSPTCSRRWPTRCRTTPRSICGDRRSTVRRARRAVDAGLANHLLARRGVAVGDHVGIYAYNGPEWVEAMFGIWKARGVPINVNYRYVEAELAYLFDNADLTALVHGREFIPRIDAVRADVPKLKAFVSIEDGTDEDLATIGAVEYEAALAARVGRARARARAAPTTSTCSTPAAPPACRRA